MSNLTENSMGHLLYLQKQYLTPCQSQQQIKWDTSCLIADWTTTGEKRQPLMIFTNTVQCRWKGIISPSLVRTVWKQRYTLQIQKSGHHSIYLESCVIQRRMKKQSGFNVEEIENDNYPEGKTVWRINLNNKWTQQNKNRLINKSTSKNKTNYKPLKVLHSLQRLTLGC